MKSPEVQQREEVERLYEKNFEKIAEILAPPADQMVGTEMLSAKQQHKRAVQEVAEELRTNDMLLLFGEGIDVLAKHPAPQARQMIDALTAGLLKIKPKSFKISSDNRVKRLEEILNIEATLWHWVEDTGVTCCEKGDFAQGVPLLALVAFGQSSRSIAWFRLGMALYKEGRYEMAASASLIAYSLTTQQPEFSLLLAACYHAQGKKDEAAQLLQVTQQSLEENHLQLPEEWAQLQEHLKKELKKELDHLQKEVL